MNKVKLLIYSSILIVLNGCMTSEQYMSMLTNTCNAYGFKQGTTEFSQCLQQADAQYRAEDSARRSRAQQSFSNAQQQLKGNGTSSGTTNCYRTPGVPNSYYCQ